jgi:hypothetical protein
MPFVLDSYTRGLLIVLASSLIAVLGLLITRKLLDMKKLPDSHEVSGYLLSVVGTLYAVLLGLVVVDAMQQFQQARTVTEHEASCLADIFLLSSKLPEPKRAQVKHLCSEYAAQVVAVEWKMMDNIKECPVARSLALELSQTLMDFEPKTQSQQIVYAQMISDCSQFWQNRRDRINIATNGIPKVEWITLIVGGFITVFFTYFFGLQNLRLQIMMTAMVATLISLNLFLVLLFGYPFAGDLCVSNKAFLTDQYIFTDKFSITH